MANTSANDWDEGSPIISEPRRQGAAEILNLRKGVSLRMNREHDDMQTGGFGGEHTAGSAKVYYGTVAPTLRPDGVTALSAGDYGRLWIHSTTFVVSVYTATGWVAALATTTYVPVLNFEKLAGGAGLTLPIDQTGLTNGHVYIVNVWGTTIQSGAGYTISITVNGVTRTLEVADGSSANLPFMIPFVITVASSRIRISASSNVQNIGGMLGVRVT